MGCIKTVHVLVFDNKYIWGEGMNRFLQWRHLSNAQLKPLVCTPTQRHEKEKVLPTVQQ